MVEGLANTMIVSVAKAHLIHTWLTESEWAQVEGVKAGVGKKFLRISRRASRRGVMYELGWTTVQGWVWKERLGVYARLKETTGMMGEAFDEGVKLAEEGREDGKDTGLLGNVKAILTELGLKEYWGRQNTPKKAQWKKIVRQAVMEWEQRKRKTWKNRKGMSPQWGMAMVLTEKESPVLQMTGSDRNLLAGVRLMITKEEMEDTERQTKECRMCGMEGQKGIIHLVTGCGKTAKAREIALPKEGMGWSNRRKWGELTKGGNKNMAYLREVARLYKEALKISLMPWVGDLGSRKKEGMIGMSVLVQTVSEWVEKGKEGNAH